MTDKYAVWTKPTPKKIHWFTWIQSRPVHLFTVALILIALLVMTTMQAKWARQSLALTASAPLRLLAQQYGLLLAEAVEERDLPVINTHLSRLVTSPLIERATVFDLQGNILGSAGEASAQPHRSSQERANKFVSAKMVTITNEQEIKTAMLLLTVNNLPLTQAQQQLTRTAFNVNAGLLVIGLITGIVLTLLVWRYRFLWLNKIR